MPVTYDQQNHLFLSLITHEDFVDLSTLEETYQNLERCASLVRVKSLKAVEKGAMFPRLEFCFYNKKDPFEFHLPVFSNFQSGHFELLQQIHHCSHSTEDIQNEQEKIIEVSNVNPEGYQFRGYFFLAFKTLKDMATEKFEKSWKTWTGARFICSLLPQPYYFNRLSFFKQCGISVEFKYIMVLQINDLMLNVEDALNLASYVKQRLCAYVGVYREIKHSKNSNGITVCTLSPEKETSFASSYFRPSLSPSIQQPLSPQFASLPYVPSSCFADRYQHTAMINNMQIQQFQWALKKSNKFPSAQPTMGTRVLINNRNSSDSLLSTECSETVDSSSNQKIKVQKGKLADYFAVPSPSPRKKENGYKKVYFDPPGTLNSDLLHVDTDGRINFDNQIIVPLPNSIQMKNHSLPRVREKQSYQNKKQREVEFSTRNENYHMHVDQSRNENYSSVKRLVRLYKSEQNRFNSPIYSSNEFLAKKNTQETPFTSSSRKFNSELQGSKKIALNSGYNVVENTINDFGQIDSPDYFDDSLNDASINDNESLKYNARTIESNAEKEKCENEKSNKFISEKVKQIDKREQNQQKAVELREFMQKRWVPFSISRLSHGQSRLLRSWSLRTRRPSVSSSCSRQKLSSKRTVRFGTYK